MKYICVWAVFLLFCTLPPALAQSATEAPPAAVSNEEDAQTTPLFDIVSARAKELAANKFSPPQRDDNGALSELDYQQYRAINFRAERALWRDHGLFEVQFFHPGFLYRHPVAMREVNSDGIIRKIPFSTDQFEYRQGAADTAAKIEGSPGFAGLRIHFPLNSDEYKDEIAVFLGASYFRLVGPGHTYGLSARGLAIDTAASSGEEFPFFRDFWLVQPAADAAQLELYALLDSPSVAGAYKFVLQPGVSTSTTVEARLYPRKTIAKLGIAPLTSMFHHGENSTRFVDDFRPEVHDSDGLLMQTSAQEWIWRPLSNPKSLQVVSLSDTNPRGFGLVQRDREFAHYLDAEADYHRRPSHWVTPIGEWGAGRVELVEIPTDSETNDNIVAYWVPEQAIDAGEEYRFSYRLHTFDGLLPEQKQAHVMRTRSGWAAMPGADQAPPKKHRRFVVDFAGGNLGGVAPAVKLDANLEVTAGKVQDVQVRALPAEGHWRVVFELIPESDAAVDMRLSLSLRGKQLTEVWNYVWSPDAVGP